MFCLAFHTTIGYVNGNVVLAVQMRTDEKIGTCGAAEIGWPGASGVFGSSQRDPWGPPGWGLGLTLPPPPETNPQLWQPPQPLPHGLPGSFLLGVHNDLGWLLSIIGTYPLGV